MGRGRTTRSSQGPPINANILAFCNDPAKLYAATLVFKTLRVGLPTANVRVYDNGSSSECYEVIAGEAREAGCDVRSLPARIHQSDFINMVLHVEDGPTVILDTDIIFWKSVEDWDFSGKLMAGRYIQKHFETMFSAISAPRLHTSLLFIPDTQAVIDVADKADLKFWPGYFDLFRPVLFKDTELKFYDVGAVFYSLYSNMMAGFGPEQLRSYDHLSCGGYLSDWAKTAHPVAARHLQRIHMAVKGGDFEAARGLWKLQDRYYETVQAIVA